MTKSDDKRVPALRFKGFTDEWEQRKLKNLVDFYSGLTYHPENIREKGTFVIRSSNIKDGQLVTGDNIFVAPEIVNSTYVKKDDIIVVVRNGSRKLIGKHTKLNFNLNNAVIGAFMTGIRSNNNNFINAIFDSDNFKREIHKNLGATINQITTGELKRMNFYIPSLTSEQNYLGNLMKVLDKLITLQQRKLRQLKLLKNALLKRMFTAKKSPTLRFRDFSKDWKLHKLQDITDRLDNARVPVTASKRIAGSTPYYGANGIQDYVKGYTHDGEFLLVAEDGANNINDYPVICAKGKIWVNNHAHVLQAKNKKIDILFLMYALKFLNMKKYLVGGGRSKLNAETMMKLALKLPELDEEHNIGVLIKNMDVLITQYKYRIQKINKFKQFLLQNMFI
ncbi:restriction endonuclease subunit S [uncultured Lactobacillus sp.]|uniref:restriction endonuclease subunit S n=1 Tax=uncultured Lactobacillus sp. TaxID=153152 RepID=UPI00258ACEED|nr:restriction endonuclease subunit S [uncultured Lactobacillus sp.]